MENKMVFGTNAMRMDRKVPKVVELMEKEKVIGFLGIRMAKNG